MSDDGNERIIRELFDGDRPEWFDRGVAREFGLDYDEVFDDD